MPLNPVTPDYQAGRSHYCVVRLRADAGVFRHQPASPGTSCCSGGCRANHADATFLRQLCRGQRSLRAPRLPPAPCDDVSDDVISAGSGSGEAAEAGAGLERLRRLPLVDRQLGGVVSNGSRDPQPQ